MANKIYVKLNVKNYFQGWKKAKEEISQEQKEKIKKALKAGVGNIGVTLINKF